MHIKIFPVITGTKKIKTHKYQGSTDSTNALHVYFILEK